MTFNAYDNIVEAMQHLHEKGFVRQFKFENGALKCVESGKSYQPSDLKILEYHRFEGMSNPSDMSIVYALDSGMEDQGTIVMNYTSGADSGLATFLEKVKIQPLD